MRIRPAPAAKRSGPKNLRSGAAATTAVILLNWKRPQNIGRLVRTAHEALPEAAIFVVDQAEGPDRLAARDDVPLELCWLRSQANAGCGARIKLAAELPFDHFLCTDDDLFLSAEQIRALIGKLRDEPERAHGIIGQRLIRTGPDKYRVSFVQGDQEVSILNQIYAFTGARARATLELGRSAGYRDWSEVMCTDDILLSCAGPGAPRSHDLGPWEQCPTASAQEVATYQAAGFHDERTELLKRLIAGGRVFLAEGKAGVRAA
jgi:hypothetical protein